MSLLTIKVDERDVEQGECGSSVLCPIALAADRALRELFAGSRVAVNVGGSVIEVWVNSGPNDMPDLTLLLPEEARDFIAAFDAQEDEEYEAHTEKRRPPMPGAFEFTVTVPDMVQP